MARNFLMIDPLQDMAVLKGLASNVRVNILKLIQKSRGMNVNDIATALSLPQSTVSSNVAILEDAGLLRTETHKARKGNQKMCFMVYDEILVAFKPEEAPVDTAAIEVAMPIGLYTGCAVSAPCGLCTTDGIIGLLDVPETFLDPGRMRAGLIWFTRGYVEYQFPNNVNLMHDTLKSVSFSMELSSEVPGTSADWPSDISVWVNSTEVGTWTSPGDYGDKRGVYTPDWWKLKGSQYGKLKTFTVNGQGTFVDGMRISDVTLDDLDVADHHSIRLRVGISNDARHPGGINIFGRGFGNYDQDIVMRLETAS
ncbi:transcriptional regulator [Roseinatronobacter sp. S2]|uniref:ArsR/SmtB family transcription factor n=1 Tax=Roseinatronobacter sp. S2 TaxID=3035471 RepID=UPI002410AFA3|nr:helix-turn-helix domain-containing protein [Roseinatronobacter sp. S2]WFE76928.1 helix-turn-helix domain-containing protein [Roseinatronobacter sp. S2]